MIANPGSQQQMSQANEINLLPKGCPKNNGIRNDKNRNVLHIINFMVKGSSWKAESGSSIQEICCLLWILGVHYDIQKIPTLNLILNKINPVHILPLLPLVYFNLISS
jgi:hypothetical protein